MRDQNRNRMVRPASTPMRSRSADSSMAMRSRRSSKSAVMSEGSIKRMMSSKGPVDYPFLMVVCILLAFGLMMLFSASNARAYASFGDSLWYFKRQFMGVVIGGVAMYFFSRFDYHKLAKWAFAGLLGAIFLLVLVVIPGIGTTTNGATRWLFGFQPSEIAKIALILFFSCSLAKNQDSLEYFGKGFLPYIGILGVFILLLALEPHFSCIILITFSSMLILFVAGAKIKHFVIIGIPGVIGAVAMIILEPYRLARVTSFLDPFADAKGDGWQIVQSLYAIGSGGFFGVGLGQSRQKYMSLPEPQNDFIFSVLAEELGLLGAILVIGLFIFLIVRGIKIAAKSPDLFGTLLVTGIVGIVAFQALINIAVVTSSIPVTGMPLPFFSFGSTALSITMAEMGIVLNVSRQARMV